MAATNSYIVIELPPETRYIICMEHNIEDKLPDLVIESRGGVIVSIYSRNSLANVIVVDWDEITDERKLALQYKTESLETLTNEMRSITQAAC